MDGTHIDEVYKGCSSFTIDKDGGVEHIQSELPNDEGEPTAYSITKKTCKGEKCNADHVPPVDPEEPEIPEGNYCQVCSVTVDQFNRTVGVGQDKCWDGSNQYEQNCGPNQYCVTDLEIDWFPKGEKLYYI